MGARRECRAFLRCFVLHKDNSDFEKVLTWVLLMVWGVITVGIAFGYADATNVYTTLTGVVWLLVGRTWGVESAKFDQ